MRLNVRWGKFFFGVATMLCLLHGNAIAQRTRTLRCPKPGKEKVYRPTPPYSLEVAAGAQTSFMYHNDAVLPSEYFKFGSTPGLYAAITANVPLSSRFGFFTGLQLGLNSQGISYSFYENNTSTRDMDYVSSALIRWTAGLSYYVTPSITISAAPYVCFNSVYDNTHVTRLTGPNGNINSQPVSNSRDYDTNIYPGISVTGSVKVYRRLSLGLQGAADLGKSPPTEVNLTVYRNGQSEIANGRIEPKLAYAGLFLSYRLFERYGG